MSGVIWPDNDLDDLSEEDRLLLRKYNIRQIMNSPELEDVFLEYPSVLRAILDSDEAKGLRDKVQRDSKDLRAKLKNSKPKQLEIPKGKGW